MKKQPFFDEELSQESWDREHQAQMQSLFWKISNGEIRKEDLSDKQKKMIIAWGDREIRRVDEKIQQTKDLIAKLDRLLFEIDSI